MQRALRSVFAIALPLFGFLAACSGNEPDTTQSSQENILGGGSKCPEIIFHVCGNPPGANYGVTYQNECWAEKAGATNITSGTCPTTGQTCTWSPNNCVNGDSCVVVQRPVADAGGKLACCPNGSSCGQ